MATNSGALTSAADGNSTRMTGEENQMKLANFPGGWKEGWERRRKEKEERCRKEEEEGRKKNYE